MARVLATPGSDVVLARVLRLALEAGMEGDALRQLRGHESWAERSWIWGRIMQILRDDGFPIRVAQSYSVGEIGALGMVAQVAPDLRGAFERMIRYQQVLAGSVLARMRDDRACDVTLFEVLPVEGSGLGARCRREEMVASGLKMARDITGEHVRPRRVCFAHAAPSVTREHEAFFDCEVRFGAWCDGLEFDPETLAVALPGADAAQSEFWADHLRAITGEPALEAPTLESRVSEALRSRVGSSSVSMETIAHELDMSPRTLRRRLLESGTRYHELLDRVRRELADELLATPGRRISEVALLLGFSDSSAFHRAYVRWTGTTPARGRAYARPATRD